MDQQAHGGSPGAIYNKLAVVTCEAIVMARDGRHREGFTTSIIGSLKVLREFAVSIGQVNSLADIDKLIAEFESAIEEDEKMRNAPSPFAYLVKPDLVSQNSSDKQKVDILDDVAGEDAV